jgi:hypothetical protein
LGCAGVGALVLCWDECTVLDVVDFVTGFLLWVDCFFGEYPDFDGVEVSGWVERVYRGLPVQKRIDTIEKRTTKKTNDLFKTIFVVPV